MDIPKDLIPENCNLRGLIEDSLKESKDYEGLIFAAHAAFTTGEVFGPPKDSSNIYVYAASMKKPLKIGHRDKYVRSFCYDPFKRIVYDAGDYRTIFNTLEGKVVEIDGEYLLARSAIFSMVYHDGEIYFAPHSEGVFKLSNKELVTKREDQVIQSLFVFENQLCDACRGKFMRFTKTGKEIGPVPYEVRYVIGYKDTIYHSGEYGIKDALEDKLSKKREGSTLALLPFGNTILDAGEYCSIQDFFSDKIFLPFVKHITAMNTIPLKMVEEFRERYECT